MEGTRIGITKSKAEYWGPWILLCQSCLIGGLASALSTVFGRNVFYFILLQHAQIS